LIVLGALLHQNKDFQVAKKFIRIGVVDVVTLAKNCFY